MKKIERKIVTKAPAVLVILVLVCLYMNVSFAGETEVLLNKLVEKKVLTSAESQEVRNEMVGVKQKEEKKKKEDEELKKEKEKLQMKIGGYTQLMYVSDPTLDDKEPLIVRRARVSFSKVLNEWASFKLQPDFAGIAGASGGGNVAFREAYIDLIAHGELARFRIGQYHQPFGFENNFSSSSKKVADTPFYMKSVLTNDYDYGVQWWGSLYQQLFKWRIGIMNGTSSTTEDNSKKDISGLFLVSPLKELEIGVSRYERNLDTSHHGLHLKVETERPFPIFFTGEYVGGKDSEGVTNVLDVIATLEVKPFVGKGILSELAPVVRYEYWDPNTDNEKDERKHLTFGLNFYPNKAVRVLADYTIKKETPSKDNNRLNIMLQVKY